MRMGKGRSRGFRRLCKVSVMGLKEEIGLIRLPEANAELIAKLLAGTGEEDYMIEGGRRKQGRVVESRAKLKCPTCGRSFTARQIWAVTGAKEGVFITCPCGVSLSAWHGWIKESLSFRRAVHGLVIGEKRR